MTITQAELIKYVNSLVGKRINHDGWYGAQCVDLIMHIMYKFFGFTPHGNAIDYMHNAMPKGAKRYRKGEAQIQAGDIAIWKWGSWDIYGHIGVVTAVNGRSITSVEQNVDGNADSLTVGGPARVRTRTDDCLVGFIRLPLETDKRTMTQTWTRVPEEATFTVTVDKINIRREPSRSSQAVAHYSKGQSVKYDSYCVNDSHVWISWIGGSGLRCYMAIGEHNGNARTSVWGTFK